MSIRQGFALGPKKPNNAPSSGDGASRLNPMTGAHDRVPGFEAPKPEPPQPQRFHVRGMVQADGNYQSSEIGERHPLILRSGGGDDQWDTGLSGGKPIA